MKSAGHRRSVASFGVSGSGAVFSDSAAASDGNFISVSDGAIVSDVNLGSGSVDVSHGSNGVVVARSTGFRVNVSEHDMWAEQQKSEDIMRLNKVASFCTVM